MSKHKSDLLKRHPIDSTGELLIEHGKYRLADVTFWRQVVLYGITANRKVLEATLECGHKRTLTKRTKVWWEDEVPGTLECPVCREDAAFDLAEAARRKR